MDATLNHSLRIEALSGTAGIGEHLDELPSVLFIPLIDLLGKHGLRTRMVLQDVLCVLAFGGALVHDLA